MGIVKGQEQHGKWVNGERLTLKQSVLANCYSCNGFEQSGEDCKAVKSCPLYKFSPYGRKAGLHRF